MNDNTELISQMGQKSTKYRDEEIKTIIDGAIDSLMMEWDRCGAPEISAAITAQAMIAYNTYIDKRWDK